MRRRRNNLVWLGAIVTVAGLLVWSNTGVSGDEDRAWLGVSLQEVTKDTRKKLDLKRGEGVEVCYVTDDSPADYADLEVGDVVLAVDGVELKSPRHLTRLIRKKNPGDKVSLQVIHDGNKKNLNIELAAYDDHVDDIHLYSFGGVKAPGLRFFGSERPYLGVHIQDMSADLAKYFNVDAGDGVLITDVEEDSPAEAAGIKAGDIFAEIDGETIESSDDVVDILSDYDPEDEVELTVIRSGKEQKIKVELEESRFGFRRGAIRIGPRGDFRTLDIGEPHRLQIRIEERIRNEVNEKIRREIEATRRLKELRHVFELPFDGHRGHVEIIKERPHKNTIEIDSEKIRPGEKSLLRTI